MDSGLQWGPGTHPHEEVGTLAKYEYGESHTPLYV